MTIPYDTRQTATPRPEVLPQRARGAAQVSARLRRSAGLSDAGDAIRPSVIGDLSMSGAAKLLFPRSRGPLQAVYLNASGGITGGDDFALNAEAEENAHLVLTTQAAERIYRAMPGEPGRVRTRLTLRDGARLDWLPQETILFEGSALDRSLSIDMPANARLLACETLVFGRPAMGEKVHDLRLVDRIDLRIDGRLAYADRLRLMGDADATLARSGVASGAGAMATVIHAAPGAAASVEALRKMLPETAGVSALTDDLVALRILSVDAFVLRGHLGAVLRFLSGAALPRPWMI